MADEPRKTAGFYTGVPAPVGAGLVFLPLYLWIVTFDEQFRNPVLVGAWLVAMAFLMISSLPTLTWGKLRLRKNFRLEALLLFGLVGAALLTETWWTLIGICAVYLALLPFGWLSYARIRRQRGRSDTAPL